MRIRKRQAIFSSSESLSPFNLSDPNLINRSPVMVQLGDGNHAHTEPKPCSTSLLSQHVSASSSLDLHQPFDQTLPLIGKLNNGCDYPSGIEKSGVQKQHNKQDPLDEKIKGQEKESGDLGENKSNHISKGDILVVSQVLPSSTTSPQDGRWCEGEKSIPLKKRRARFENEIMEINDTTATTATSTTTKVKPKMKTKMNKKCSIAKEDGDEESETKVNNKKRVTKRGSALMEGSRCSRVNGRGWRCCQQTLVGYSLCEHHLGKGRLRSMTSVRNRSIGLIAPINNVVDSATSSNSDFEKKITSGNDVVDNKLELIDEKKPKKRMKLGMVKARSMSSLLGQTDNKVVVGDENNK